MSRPRLAGDFIYLEGMPAASIWFVKSGLVTLARNVGASGGMERVHAVRGAGSFVGIEALVQGTYADTARCAGDVVLCWISRQAIDTWLGGPGSPLRVVLEQTVQELTGDPVRLAAPDGRAASRVARWILDEEAAGTASGKIPRRTIADLLGMVPETLSRALAELNGVGAIESTRTSIRVVDLDRLRAVADEDLGDR